MDETPTTNLPPLTGPQIEALRIIAATGRTLRVHPAREEALRARGYIAHIPADGLNTARLTEQGRAALTSGGAA